MNADPEPLALRPGLLHGEPSPSSQPKTPPRYHDWHKASNVSRNRRSGRIEHERPAAGMLDESRCSLLS